MKKIIAILALVFCLVMLAACGENEAEDDTTQNITQAVTENGDTTVESGSTTADADVTTDKGIAVNTTEIDIIDAETTAGGTETEHEAKTTTDVETEPDTVTTIDNITKPTETTVKVTETEPGAETTIIDDETDVTTAAETANDGTETESETETTRNTETPLIWF